MGFDIDPDEKGIKTLTSVGMNTLFKFDIDPDEKGIKTMDDPMLRIMLMSLTLTLMKKGLRLKDHSL